MSGIRRLCYPVCKFIDYYLKPLGECLPSFLKDMTEVLRRIDGITMDPDIIYITTDIKLLYTSIRHQDGIEAVCIFLGMSNWESETCDLDVELLEFFLTHNFFLFKDSILFPETRNHLRAPSYANLLPGMWERRVLQGDGVQCWLRYINNIFIWQGSDVQLVEFIKQSNEKALNIKRTFSLNPHKVDFPDMY